MAPTSATTMYSAPDGVTPIVTSIAVSNSATTPGSITITLDDVALISGAVVPPQGVLTLDVKQVFSYDISVLGGATSLGVHICGVEVSS
ncbi:hypothetical protein [Streptomyces sp. NRRL F-5123]|uniref:hypothetical protein n=1 Tax=Streptomyces sp. NRRL F-5123 TaxID=1463856 RepID=UPI00131D1F85|nr:hypothetical protein [Streptomyces sp. NRRL F-5123]